MRFDGEVITMLLCIRKGVLWTSVYVTDCLCIHLAAVRSEDFRNLSDSGFGVSGVEPFGSAAI